ncbi:MAG: hypothetical protein FWF51_08845 [Chitinivibrionia bacterium]|nr:hypothetical protein [Chitinivibrionia bacterium]
MEFLNAAKGMSQNDSRVIGTWINVENNVKIVFNSDGTGTGWHKSVSDNKSFKYGTVGNKITVAYILGKSDDEKTDTDEIDYVISNDGKTMIFTNNYISLLKKTT